MSLDVRFDAPAGFAAEAEYPIGSLPDVPIWSENFWFVAYDQGAQLGVWTHVGRSAWDPTLWRETTLVYLPTGEFLINKNFGRHQTERGPRASTLLFEIIEPWNQGSTRMDGTAVRVTREQAFSRTVGEGRHEPLHIDLDWHALSPVWAMGEPDIHDQRWGDTRYEQFTKVDGTVEFGGETFPFQGTALRDHTRGPRDLLPIRRHLCSNCWFPDSNRSFQTVFVDHDGAGEIRRAAIVQDGELFEAEVVRETALLAEFEGYGQPFELELAWSGGRATIEGEVVQIFPLAWSGPSEFVMGFDRDVSYSVMFESFVRYRWDGEDAVGLTERSLRHRTSY